MNNSLYTAYVGVGSRAAGRNTIHGVDQKPVKVYTEHAHRAEGEMEMQRNVCLCEEESLPVP